LRLDEWQQFIESQFLDDAVEEKPATGREPAAADQQTTQDHSIWVDEAVAAEPLPTVQATEAPKEPVIQARSVPRIEQERNVAPVAVPPPAPAAERTPEPAPRRESPDLITADLPDFATYLKPRKKREAEPPSRPSTPVTAAPPDSIPAVAPESIKAVFPEPVKVAAQSPAKVTAKKPALKPREPRKSRTHARHARNVAPAAVEPGLSAADLLQQVPRHIQTLLALGREEEEVAQFSYKRTFEESRQELIARLIDPVLTLEETARLLNVCPTTVRRYTNRGILSYYRKEIEAGAHTAGEKETRQRRFRLSDILTFLEAQHGAVPETDRSTKRASHTREDAAAKH
jgi:hypothetical protein